MVEDRENRFPLNRVGNGQATMVPFYVVDFTSDPPVEAMTPAEVGGYILLLCKAWHEKPPGTLPQDDKKLRLWARFTPLRWKQSRGAILAPFSKGKDRRWHQKRMKQEAKKQIHKSRQAREAVMTRWKR